MNELNRQKDRHMGRCQYYRLAGRSPGVDGQSLLFMETKRTVVVLRVGYKVKTVMVDRDEAT